MIIKIGIKTLNEFAIPIGTESGILILIASIFDNALNNSTAKIAINIETNKPCAPITPVPNPPIIIGSCIPFTTVLIVFGHTAK